MEFLVDPLPVVDGVGGIDRQPLVQAFAGGTRCALEDLQVRPGRFGIDVIDSHRRYAAPVVDAGLDQPPQPPGAQIGGA